MSLNPNNGHLYHDFSITNSYTVLDAKEKMTTREINARETKYLEKYACRLDKAKRIYRNKNEREQREIRKHLENINTKTVSLDKGLKRESQRLKLFDGVLNETNTSKTSATFTKTWQSAKNSRRHNFVSAKSLYSNIYSEQRNSARQKRSDSSNENQQTVLLPTTVKLLRKADNITKTLHRLYSKNLERRWKDTNRTIVDVLNSESNEELEKALFVLRGTHAGTLIEDILRERVWARRARSESYGRRNWSLSSGESKHGDDDAHMSDAAFVTEINVRDKMEPITVARDNKLVAGAHTHGPEALKHENKLPDISNGTNLKDKAAERESAKSSNALYVSETTISEMFMDNITANDNDTGVNKTELSEFTVSKPQLRSSSVKSISDETKEKLIRQWVNVSDVDLDLSNVFERDDPDSMSSTIVNPSENEYMPTLKWRDIFNTPAVWKQNRKMVQHIKKPKPISLVKVHGQYRQTMLN